MTMNQGPGWAGSSRAGLSPARRPAPSEPANLADILERVLDKGIVIAGDIRINLLDIELLTIKIRLIIASVDRAREMGIDWWEHDPTLSAGKRDVVEENERLRRRIGELEAGRGSAPDGMPGTGEPRQEEEPRRRPPGRQSGGGTEPGA
ncbi:gas vesicle protein [Streptomyces sp. ActVer]|uniref:gas vesicle protein n=1 Tax=Streptomyces sp. ActVer TaxID=3014558 RepID=UPI0022B4BFEC|nr:gas vesicle protein [Streptomyces sp. ActVer]MCZ4507365.1 gas vesicle protein [Streptomyces sp. ActVer]